MIFMQNKKGRANPNEKKIKQAEMLAELIGKYKICGMLNLYKMPARSFQKIKRDLSERAVIKVAKSAVLVKALETAGKKELAKIIAPQPAIILTNENPFKIFKFIQKNKSKASAKAGDKAPEDIVVPAGPTDIPPGPAISALTKVKIAARVEGGKIAVAKDSLVAKKGEVISAELASALAMVKIEPMEIGLDVAGMLEGSVLYGKDSLAVDDEKVLADLILGANASLNLSVFIGWPTKQNIELLLAKGFREAKGVGVEAGVLDSGIIEDLLAKGKLQADALAGKAGAQ